MQTLIKFRNIHSSLITKCDKTNIGKISFSPLEFSLKKIHWLKFSPHFDYPYCLQDDDAEKGGNNNNNNNPHQKQEKSINF